MQTPHGFFCKHYYSDYFRGNTREECRLLSLQPQSVRWSADLCKKCPVPKILLANACQNMTLRAKVVKGILGTNKKVTVSSYCLKAQADVAEPEIGCGLCHQSEVFESINES